MSNTKKIDITQKGKRTGCGNGVTGTVGNPTAPGGIPGTPGNGSPPPEIWKKYKNKLKPISTDKNMAFCIHPNSKLKRPKTSVRIAHKNGSKLPNIPVKPLKPHKPGRHPVVSVGKTGLLTGAVTSGTPGNLNGPALGT